MPPKIAAKAGSETRTAFAAACALYIPCLTLAVWGASLAPASSSVGAEGIMLAVAQFESAAAAPATAAEPAAVPEPEPEPEPAAEPEPEQAAASELKPEPEPQPEPEPEPEPPLPAPDPIPEPVEVVKPVRKVTVARRPPEKRPEAKRPDRPRRPHAPEVAAPVPAAPAVAAAPAAAPAEPALLVVGRDGDPFLGEVREAVLSTLECPREARRMRRQGTVTVQFVIGPDGCVSGISVHEGSGHDMLDREACAAVARAASLWGSPGRTVRIRMPVVFTLKKGRG
ncbi:MAG: TonB family protein [Sutterella sp.]|nr:TonB family protein [Sutterella sp.]